MRTLPKSAGAGLLVYGIGVTFAFLSIGSPGGDYEPAKVSGYLSSGHWPAAFVLAYVAAFASLGLVVFGQALRSLGGTLGELLWGLAVAGTATSVVGAFVTGGLDVAMAEGGRAVQAGVPHPVVYTITEIGNLLCVCGPAFFAGVIAIALAAKAPLPGWLRAFSGIAGACGILAPFFFTYFVFVLWTIVAGVSLLASRRSAAQRATKPVLPVA
ncbi:MAG TPA: hypothetical protein VFL69_09790 [Marmoricola sp.]|nr:hypothetical protein [Marmoricola sp.]